MISTAVFLFKNRIVESEMLAARLEALENEGKKAKLLPYEVSEKAVKDKLCTLSP